MLDSLELFMMWLFPRWLVAMFVVGCILSIWANVFWKDDEEMIPRSCEAEHLPEGETTKGENQ